MNVKWVALQPAIFSKFSRFFTFKNVIIQFPEAIRDIFHIRNHIQFINTTISINEHTIKDFTKIDAIKMSKFDKYVINWTWWVEKLNILEDVHAVGKILLVKIIPRKLYKQEIKLKLIGSKCEIGTIVFFVLGAKT